MKKFFYRLKGREGRSQLQKQKTDFTQTIHDPGGDSSKQVVDQQDPDLSPREAGPPVDPQDDIVTFTGFETWLSSFTPDPHSRNIVELPAGQINVEILTIKGFPPGDYINLTLHRAKKPRCAEEFTVTIQGPWYMTLNQVAKLLKEHGYREPYSAKHATLAVKNWNEDKAMPTEFQICAVDGPSCYAEPGLLINRDESIGSFTNALRQLRVRCKDGKVVATSFPAELEITFHRTLRLPEDGELHYQSHGLGHITVMSIASISRQLQNSGNASLTDMARKGGVFFPLYQREAMFLSFKATSDSFAIRPFVGGVNAISGLPWNSPVPRQLLKQDYLSVPPQKYLDGIAVGKKTVRQFVAMPLGSGYSVEKQVTGKENVGGMQLEITPGSQWYVRGFLAKHASPSPHDTPRSLNTDLLVLDWKSFHQGVLPGIGGSNNPADWIQSHRPIYMRHLYGSQLVQNNPQTGYCHQRPNVAPEWRPGADVYMTAVYGLNLTLSYIEDGKQHTMAVQWLPWWTPSECYKERRRAGAVVLGSHFDDRFLRLLYQGSRLRHRTLEEQGIQDNSIIQVVLLERPWLDRYPMGDIERRDEDPLRRASAFGGFLAAPSAMSPLEGTSGDAQATKYVRVFLFTISSECKFFNSFYSRSLSQTGWAMGLAAGVGVYQAIEKDPFKSAVWAKARTTVLSIQILNSVVFEELTGMLAPPTPITPETYKERRLPFYAFYGEGVVTDGATNLRRVKGVGELDAAGGDIQLGSSLNSSTKVACTCCERMLCDSVLRPCNHIFCISCITTYMIYGNCIFCRICNMRATKLVGFSAPMALPGQDRADFSDTRVITTEPQKIAWGLHSLSELAIGDRLKSLLNHALDGRNQETKMQKTIYELPG